MYRDAPHVKKETSALMMKPPRYVREEDHAAVVDELVECSTRTAARLDAQSHAINLLTLTVSELEARLAALTIV